VRFAALVAVLITVPAAAHAQLGEIQAGIITGYGTADSYRGGAGVSIAMVPGRIAYAGLRYVYHWGSDSVIPGGSSSDLRISTDSRIIAADLGFQFPIGSAELVLGGSIGATGFHQTQVRMDPGGTTATTAAWEFTAAPSITMYFRLGRILIAPEIQWDLAGDPDFPVHVPHRGPLFYLRLVLPFEVDRIRQ
jgi:hypothetical protein